MPDAATGRDIVCIACPVGCRLVVRPNEGGEAEVTGNRCPKGEAYGREEIAAPKRTVTAVVRTDSADYPCAPVRTDRPLPRERTRELLAELGRMRVTLPGGGRRRAAGGLEGDGGDRAGHPLATTAGGSRPR